MNRISRNLAIGAAIVPAILGLLGGRRASAQNTYADAPFNQGSLFYRPSGAKPPATSNSAMPMRQIVPTAPIATAPRQVTAYRPVAPKAPRVKARRRWGWFRRTP